MEFAQSATSIALNVVVLLFPLPMLWFLPMSPHRVWDLILVYVLGALCCAAAIIRLVLLHASIAKEATDLSVVHIHSKQLVFMIIETNCSIIAACLPCYGALLRGGESLASIVRSFLVIHGRASSRSDSSFSSLHSGKHYPIHGVRDLDADTGSQVELTGPVERWSRTTTQVTIKVGGDAHQHDECRSPGIVVHTELDISTKGADPRVAPTNDEARVPPFLLFVVSRILHLQSIQQQHKTLCPFTFTPSKTPPTTNSAAFRSVEHLPSSVAFPGDLDRRFSVSTNEPVPPLPPQHPAHSNLVHRSQSHRRPNTLNNHSVVPPAVAAPPRIVDADPSDQSWQHPPPAERPEEHENPRRSRRNLFSLHSHSSSSQAPRESTGFLERRRSIRKTSPAPQPQEQRPLSVDTAADPHSPSKSREYVVDTTQDPSKSPVLQEQEIPHEPRPPRSPQNPSITRSNTDSTLLEHIYRPSPVEPKHPGELAPGPAQQQQPQQNQLGLPRPASRQSLEPPSPLPPPPAYSDHSASQGAMSDRPPSGQRAPTATPPPGGHSSYAQGNNNQDATARNNAAQQPEPGRSTPSSTRMRDEGEIDLRTLVQKHDELQAKYSKVKRYYFEKEAQVQQLQNTVAHQRMAVSRTVLDDNEYANRFGRLDGAIKDLAFAFRKDWKSLPKWLMGYVNDDAHITGTKEMTAIGRAVISRWLVDELFERFFHPALDPTFSRQLKSIEMNLRRQQGNTLTDEDKENAIARISNWRRTTLDGLTDALHGPAAEEHRCQLIDHLVDNLVANLVSYLGDPPPPGLDNGARMIVENAVGIADKVPLESRDVCIEYIHPGTLLHEPNMKVEAGLPPLTNEHLEGPPDEADRESSGSTSQEGAPGGPHPGREPRMRSVISKVMGRRPNQGAAPNPGGNGDIRPPTAMEERNSMGAGRIRFASFITAEVRGRGPMNVLVKAPVYLMD
ncbi:hypothetical protein BDV41DRAFT_563902 [Aspergillus transmontanensis]|uniref:Rhodopsin domain-containing protein n=1 Tax=Aspergillus transmontanensis TaxID=1034304 RepID=A0A5N6VZM6_9EURO|nr:hypothetical protein BDV41DRAFT_563902 [Aspergillus transmontanensis]